MRLIPKTKTFKIRIAHLTFKLRQMDEFDLLSIPGCPSFFVVKDGRDGAPELSDLLGKINVPDQTDLDEQQKEKQRIIKLCLVSFRNRIKNGVLTADDVLKDADLVNMLYSNLMFQTFKGGLLRRLLHINRQKAISIYLLYKGMNFAHQYFGAGKMSKIEEYAFNACIYEAGIKEEAKVKTNGRA